MLCCLFSLLGVYARFDWRCLIWLVLLPSWFGFDSVVCVVFVCLW